MGDPDPQPPGRVRPIEVAPPWDEGAVRPEAGAEIEDVFEGTNWNSAPVLPRPTRWALAPLQHLRVGVGVGSTSDLLRPLAGSPKEVVKLAVVAIADTANKGAAPFFAVPGPARVAPRETAGNE